MIKPLSWAFLVFPLTFASEGKAASWLEEIDARIFAPSPQQQSYNEGVSLYKAGKPDEALGKFQIAAVGDDRILKAKALHNTAVIQIAKQELEPARELLKQASSFDNDSQPIKENLAWVEEQLKNAEKKNPNESESQDQKTADDEQQKEEEKSAEQKSAENEDQSAKPKPGDEKEGEKKDDVKENSGDPKDSKQADSGGGQGEKKDAESKESEASEASKENKDGEDELKDEEGKDGQKKSEEKIAEESKVPKESTAADDKSQSGEDPQKSASLDSKEGAEAGSDPNQVKILTPAEIKQQEAERLLRNIDDKIGRYPLTDTEATDRRGKDGKNW